MEKIDNKKIAMSLLLQCAWMWERCTRNPNEGEFRLTDVVQGLTSRNRTNTKPGYTLVDMGFCKHWEYFADGIDGMNNFDYVKREVSLVFNDFNCSYKLTDIFSVAKAFCQANACQSLMNKTVFGYKDGERYCRLPEEMSSTSATRKKAVVKRVSRPKAIVPPTLADRLREALLRQLAA